MEEDGGEEHIETITTQTRLMSPRAAVSPIMLYLPVAMATIGFFEATPMASTTHMAVRTRALTHTHAC